MITGKVMVEWCLPITIHVNYHLWLHQLGTEMVNLCFGGFQQWFLAFANDHARCAISTVFGLTLQQLGLPQQVGKATGKACLQTLLVPPMVRIQGRNREGTKWEMFIAQWEPFSFVFRATVDFAGLWMFYGEWFIAGWLGVDMINTLIVVAD